MLLLEMQGCGKMKPKSIKLLCGVLIMVVALFASPIMAAEVNECYITPKLASILGSIVFAIKVLVAAALFVLTMLDIAKVVLKPELEPGKCNSRPDVWKRIIIRIIIIAAIFFLPSLITLFFHMLGMDVTFCGIL